MSSVHTSRGHVISTPHSNTREWSNNTPSPPKFVQFAMSNRITWKRQLSVQTSILFWLLSCFLETAIVSLLYGMPPIEYGVSPQSRGSNRKTQRGCTPPDGDGSTHIDSAIWVGGTESDFALPSKATIWSY